MNSFEQWYKNEYGVHPKDVVKDTPADAQLQASLKAWEAGYDEATADCSEGMRFND